MKKCLSVFLIIALLLSMVVFTTSCDESSGSSNGNGGGITNPFIQYHSVKFVTNGGNRIETQKVTTSITNPPTPTRDGYLFDGWFLDSTFIAPATFPLSVNSDITLYAKWLKLTDQAKCRDCSIKMDTKLDFSATYSITPTGFDFEKLNQKGYSMRITVTYSVRYVKDYNVLWDIGYAGSPKYEVFLMNQNGLGKMEEDLSTTTSSKTRKITLTRSIADLMNDRLTLTFSTNNREVS